MSGVRPRQIRGYRCRLTSQEFYDIQWISFGGVSYAMQGRPLFPDDGGCEAVQALYDRMVVNDAALDLGGAG